MAITLLGRAVSVLLALTTIRVSADCECGYSATVGGTDQAAVFTDLVESDFTGIKDISKANNWVPQEFSIDKKAARGQFGESFRVANVETLTAKHKDEKGLADDGDAPGLQLLVSSEPDDGNVPVAELDSRRDDVFHGSFRASMKLTDIPGTCAAFFWYFNDTQEIDMEFLSREFNLKNNSFPVNLVLQSRQSADAGYDAAKTGDFVRANLPFDPTTDFHEYRIDYLRGDIYFYADGEVLANMKGDAVPTSAGHLILQHWSNGNQQWSGGPPEDDAVLTVRYVKAYFNSSDPQRLSDWEGRCGDPEKEKAVCDIPDVAKDKDAHAFFFSAHDNMTKNQTVSWPDDSSGGVHARDVRHSLVLPWALSLIACVWVL